MRLLMSEMQHRMVMNRHLKNINHCHSCLNRMAYIGSKLLDANVFFMFKAYQWFSGFDRGGIQTQIQSLPMRCINTGYVFTLQVNEPVYAIESVIIFVLYRVAFQTLYTSII